MQDFGVTNLSFEGRVQGQGFVYLATTRGLYYTFNLIKYYQRRAGVQPDVLYTALNEIKIEGKGTSRILAGPFAADKKKQLHAASIGYYWSPVWKQRSAGVADLNQGLSSIVSHPTEADTFWLCNQNGISKTTDGGKSYRLVYDAASK
jgi:hypothetical protein